MRNSCSSSLEMIKNDHFLTFSVVPYLELFQHQEYLIFSIRKLKAYLPEEVQ